MKARVLPLQDVGFDPEKHRLIQVRWTDTTHWMSIDEGEPWVSNFTCMKTRNEFIRSNPDIYIESEVVICW